jgi:hypothetical protein
MAWFEILAWMAGAAGAVAACAEFWRLRAGFFLRCDPRVDRQSRALYDRLRRAHTVLFGGDDGVRFTLLMPSDGQPDELRPVLRFGWGRSSSESTARFRRDEGLAGRAWHHGSPVLVARLPADPTPSRVRELHRELFPRRDDGTASLSEAMLRVRAILACALHDPTGAVRGVLSVDVIDGDLVPDPASADDRDVAWYRELVRVASDLGRLVEPVRDAGRSVVTDVQTLGQTTDRSASIAALRFLSAPGAR